jgi:ZIP family zinc transporter
MNLLLVVLAVSAALVIGALWGATGRMSDHLEGFLVATAGGALIVATTEELVAPATEQAPTPAVLAAVMAGAVAFVGLDSLLERKVGEDSGGGLLLAVTLDGIPENLALGVALISTGPVGVAALTGSIMLSNLPEAAGGAKAMAEDGWPRHRILGLWAVTAAALALAAVVGNLALAGVPALWLALIQGFAAGAVVSSLATAVFPRAYAEEHLSTGIAVALGLVSAYSLVVLTR